VQGAAAVSYDLYTADEVFLTSTAAGLMPVTRIDGRVVGSGEPGPVYSRLRELFDRHVEEGWEDPGRLTSAAIGGEHFRGLLLRWRVLKFRFTQFVI
jgi:hypothetical protein